jgi:hypothetical protein
LSSVIFCPYQQLIPSSDNGQTCWLIDIVTKPHPTTSIL